MVRRLTEIEKEKVCSLYQTGNYTFSDLAKKFNISRVAIGGILKRRGYVSTSQSILQRKYQINESYFDSIDTEEKAYFLGLLFADGYNNEKRNDVTLSLSEVDKEIIIKLNNILQPDKPVQYIKYCYPNSNQTKLVINNKHISNQLTKLGIHQNKSHTAIYPNYLSDLLERHFIRGVFDGDGCVTGFKNPTFSITGNIAFLDKIQQTLIKRLGLLKTKFDDRRKESCNIASLRYCGIYNVYKIYNWLYQDATIYLERKKKKFNILQAGRSVLLSANVEGLSRSGTTSCVGQESPCL